MDEGGVAGKSLRQRMLKLPILEVLKPKTADRFRAKLRREGECLVFTGARHKQGYGVVEVSRNYHEMRYPILTHRLAWALAHGEDPPPDLSVLHWCNNPPCCNPEHLYVGTAQDNVDDMIAAGREDFKGMLGRKGTSHPAAHPAELRERAIALIRADLEAMGGLNFTRIQRKTGVHHCTIRRWWAEHLATTTTPEAENERTV